MFNFNELGPICKFDGCSKEGLHQRHVIRGWCSDSLCKGAAGIRRWPRVTGELVCSCGRPMLTADEAKAQPFRDIAGHALTRIAVLRKMSADERLACPWQAYGGCAACRHCDGSGEVSPAYMIGHYQAMILLYEADELSALDDAIVSSVTRYEPKRFAEVMDAVQNNYGSLAPRAETSRRMLHRHLKALAARGRVLRVDVGESLCAYLKPDSPIARDHLGILEYFRSTMVMS